MNLFKPREVSTAAIQQFADLTNDHSRIHLDRDYALSLGLKDNFAHGLLGASWALGLLSQQQSSAEIPVTMEVNFGQPVYRGDTLTLSQSSSEKHFSLCNSDNQESSRGNVQFGKPVDFSQQKLSTTPFTADQDKVYYARDMFEDGPRGECPPMVFCEQDISTFIEFTGERDDAYRDQDKLLFAPPMLIFCRAFSVWLKAFTAVKTPDAGFPGHLQDQWQQHQSVSTGDTLTTRHQVTACRPSNSRPDMALLTITLQTSNQHGQVVQSGSVLLMMALEAKT